MNQLPLKRSHEYQDRVRAYAINLARRYRPEVADVFLQTVQKVEKQLAANNHLGTNAPYVLSGQNVVLTELYFKSGPVSYCLIHEIMSDCVGLVSLWHGVGERRSDNLTRIWRQRP